MSDTESFYQRLFTCYLSRRPSCISDWQKLPNVRQQQYHNQT